VLSDSLVDIFALSLLLCFLLAIFNWFFFYFLVKKIFQAVIAMRW